MIPTLPSRLAVTALSTNWQRQVNPVTSLVRGVRASTRSPSSSEDTTLLRVGRASNLIRKNIIFDSTNYVHFGTIYRMIKKIAIKLISERDEFYSN